MAGMSFLKVRLVPALCHRDGLCQAQSDRLPAALRIIEYSQDYPGGMTVQFPGDKDMAIALELICPDCRTASPPDSSGGVVCAGCGAVLAGPFTLCPNCGRVNDAGETACSQCGEALTVSCPGCRRINWSGAERCGGCGREMDPLAHAFRPAGASLELRRQDMLQNVASLREKEERDSRARLETLHEADRRRMQRSAEMAERARLRERRMIIITLIVAAFFLVFTVAAVVFLL
jgi:hypothetical protein